MSPNSAHFLVIYNQKPVNDNAGYKHYDKTYTFNKVYVYY